MPVAVRLGLYYAAIFIGAGAASPYASLWFRAHGLSGAAIGLILSAPLLARVAIGPALAVWADGFRLRRAPLALMGAGVAFSFLGLAITRGFWPWFVLWFIAQSLFGALSPLADVITLRRGRAHGFAYGWPRGMGSVAFIVASVGMGAVLSVASPDALLVWLIAAAIAVTLAARFLLPPDAVHEAGETLAGRERWRGLGQLARDPLFMLAVACVGLIQASHGFYYGFSAIAWRQQGVSSSLVGLLWGLGVATEVGFLWFMEPWRRRIGAERLVIFGGLGAVVRWTCLGLSPPLWVIFLVQPLHALSFTATFLGGLQLMERLAPPASASAAQTINSALSGGLLIGLATMASGRLFDLAGPRGYLVMSLIALLGLAGALCLSPMQRARNRIATSSGA